MMRPQGAQHRKSFRGTEFNSLRQARGGGDRLIIELGKSLFRKIGEVVGDDILSTAPDRRRKDVTVSCVGKNKRPDQLLVFENKRILEMLVFFAPLRTDAPFQMWLPIKQVPRPLIEDLLGSPRLEQTR